jgi:Arc/MetJ-type ribon-helix-helix transcriptional regulator
MTTINISLPEQLKKEADTLVGAGYYVSFSDLVRDGLRQIVDARRYDRWYKEAKQDEKEGRAVVLKSKKDIANYFKKI